MSRIFWDTNIFIYLLEEYGKFSTAAASLRAKMLARGDQLLTSTLTLGEILVKPMERGDVEVCAQYQHAIASTSLVIPFDIEAAKTYASLRRDRAIRAPDAIQLACAATVGTDVFITNDRRLQGKQIQGIQFIVSLEQAPL
ncbi:MAG: PIN domain-containing protein [Candidatus Korobacteraceae bacterium]